MLILHRPVSIQKQNSEVCKAACLVALLQSKQAGNIGHQISLIFQIKYLLFNIGSLLPDTCSSKH